MFTNFAQKLDAGHAGHADVAHHRGEPSLSNLCDCLRTVRAGRDSKGHSEGARNRSEDSRFVVHDENGREAFISIQELLALKGLNYLHRILQVAAW